MSGHPWDGQPSPAEAPPGVDPDAPADQPRRRRPRPADPAEREARGVALRADLAARMPALFGPGDHRLVNVAYRRGEVPGQSERIILTLDLDDAARLVRIADALVQLGDAIVSVSLGGHAEMMKTGLVLAVPAAHVGRILDSINDG